MAVTRRQLLAMPMAAAAQTTPGRRAPNVLLIITDDQGYGDLSIHGNPHLKTPNIDSIAHDGLRFTQFQVCPVCSPTRSSLMTGRYNYRTGVVDTYLGRSMMYSDEITMPELFAKAGYRTGIFGKWHLGDNYPTRSIDQGFQESLVCNGGGVGQPSDPPGNSYFDPVLQHNGRAKAYEGYCTDIFTGAAMEWIERSARAPWFAYVSTNAPHTPLTVAEDWVKPFREKGLDEVTAKVYGMVANVDVNVGKLLGKLRTLGLERDTIVVFLTDNGPQQIRYNANMRGRKGTVYQGGIRVPCFLRWPAMLPKGGSQIDLIAAHVDLLPTLAAACGVSLPKDLLLDGRSLMPLLRRETSAWPERTLFTQWHRGDEPELFRDCSARTQQYKLVNGRELYDLAADPGEQHDISRDRPEIAAKLRKETQNWFRDVSSTRGYAPPRIYLGTPHENPVILTRQDWRGPKASWDDKGLGFWEVEVTQAGRYDVNLRMPAAPEEGEASVRIGEATARSTIRKGATECRLGLQLKQGPARVEPVLRFAEGERGPHYVDIARRM
jgi:arylsulfatase A-like enzyme